MAFFFQSKTSLYLFELFLFFALYIFKNVFINEYDAEITSFRVDISMFYGSHNI